MKGYVLDYINENEFKSHFNLNNSKTFKSLFIKTTCCNLLQSIVLKIYNICPKAEIPLRMSNLILKSMYSRRSYFFDGELFIQKKIKKVGIS